MPWYRICESKIRFDSVLTLERTYWCEKPNCRSYFGKMLSSTEILLYAFNSGFTQLAFLKILGLTKPFNRPKNRYRDYFHGKQLIEFYALLNMMSWRNSLSAWSAIYQSTGDTEDLQLFCLVYQNSNIWSLIFPSANRIYFYSDFAASSDFIRSKLNIENCSYTGIYLKGGYVKLGFRRNYVIVRSALCSERDSGRLVWW